MVPIETGEDTTNKRRVVQGVYETRDNNILIIGVYGSPGGDEEANIQFYEEEVFSSLDIITYDKVKIVGDWNVYLDPTKDQQNYTNPFRYRNRTKDYMKS